MTTPASEKRSRNKRATLVSWPDGEETYESLTTITDERPMDFGAGESDEN